MCVCVDMCVYIYISIPLLPGGSVFVCLCVNQKREKGRHSGRGGEKKGTSKLYTVAKTHRIP